MTKPKRKPWSSAEIEDLQERLRVMYREKAFLEKELAQARREIRALRDAQSEQVRRNSWVQ